jgi:four helix bundle protein
MATAERFQELLAWQLMYSLSVEVWRATTKAPASYDFEFRNQIRDSSDSAHRNIAEGFGRFDPPQFLNFLNISRASAEETRSLLKKGVAVGHLTNEEYARLDRLAVRGLQAVARFQWYLRTPQAKLNAQRARHTRTHRRAKRND